MNEQASEATEVETRILNRIVAKLYLSLRPADGDVRAITQKRLSKIDQYFGIERPSVSDIEAAIEAQAEQGQEIDSEMRSRILEELIILAQGEFGKGIVDEMQARIGDLFRVTLDQEGAALSAEEQQQMLDSLLTDILGFGPLESLIHDDSVSEIMVDGYDKIYVERHGKLEDVPYHFRDNEHLMQNIRRILAPLGRRLDERSPIVDERLPDGSRVNVVIPPVSLSGPVLTIRIFRKRPLSVADLLRYGSWNEEIVQFLQACVQARLNLVLSGGTASGKTTLLNNLAGMIPADERIVIVENATELRLPDTHKYVVRMESRPADFEGKGQVTVRDLVINSLRMRPDRIILGEARSSEVLDMLQAMNTGHDGSTFSLHANSPRDALTRLEAMIAMANLSLPLLHVRQQMASAIQLIVHIERLPDGKRKVIKVTEVGGMQGDNIELKDIFEFRQTGVKDGQLTGSFTATGHIPSFLNQIRQSGIDLPLTLFTPK